MDPVKIAGADASELAPRVRWLKTAAGGVRTLAWSIALDGIAVPLLWRALSFGAERSGGGLLGAALGEVLTSRLPGFVLGLLATALALLGLFRLTVAPPEPASRLAERHRIGVRLGAVLWGALALLSLVREDLLLSPLVMFSRAIVLALGFAYLAHPFRLLGRGGSATSSLALGALWVVYGGVDLVIRYYAYSHDELARAARSSWYDASPILMAATLLWVRSLISRLRLLVEPAPRPEPAPRAEQQALDVPDEPSGDAEISARRAVTWAVIPFAARGVWFLVVGGGASFLYLLVYYSPLPALLMACLLFAKVRRKGSLDSGRWIGAVSVVLSLLSPAGLFAWIAILSLYAPGERAAARSMDSAGYVDLAALALSVAHLAALAGGAVALVMGVRRRGWRMWLFLCAAHASINAPELYWFSNAVSHPWRSTFYLSTVALIALVVWGFLPSLRAAVRSARERAARVTQMALKPRAGTARGNASVRPRGKNAARVRRQRTRSS
ncbi:hypothetical protein WME97_26265 [Sorangium sp. So ce367]|uniref:hypothetical protein n=1 Tax=Sorangium sp. So ce367 TaxID=3133305 RepID=UPI003F5F9C8D